jgi:Ribosomal protein L7/L12 C-terminal domain
MPPEFTSTFSVIGIALLLMAAPIIVVNVIIICYKVESINRKLNLLMKHSGMNLQETALREAQPLMRDGKKIEAIKRYREITGAGLAEAKAAVEKLQEGAGPA